MIENSKDKKTVAIIVNATPHETPKDKITYEEIVRIAYPSEIVNEGSTYKVSYKMKNGSTLTPLVYGSKPIKVKKDMIFNVAPANRA